MAFILSAILYVAYLVVIYFVVFSACKAAIKARGEKPVPEEEHDDNSGWVKW